MAGNGIAVAVAARNHHARQDSSDEFDDQGPLPGQAITKQEEEEVFQITNLVVDQFHQSLNSSGIAGDDNSNEAARKIGTAWRKRQSRQYVSRQVLLDRLDIEDAMCVGVVRLILVCLIFTLIVLANDQGTDGSRKLSVVTLLDNALHLENIQDFKNLEDFRDEMPGLFGRLKQFAAVRRERFPEDESVQILGERIAFTAPAPLTSVNPSVASGSFTLSAWIKADNSAIQRNIIRKPLGSDSSLSCWSWSFPEEFRFGAHDIYDGTGSTFPRELVVKGAGKPSEELSHEALVVSNNTAMFYQNGQLQNSVELSRDVTECLEAATVELGDEGMEITSLKFYGRPLKPSEISEIFQGGQPLSELATSSSLPKTEENPFQQVMQTVGASQIDILREIQRATQVSSVNTLMDLSSADRSSQRERDWLYGTDPSPYPVLPDPSYINDGGFDEHERAYWEEGGSLIRPQNSSIGWRNDSDGLTYWSLLEDPVIAETYLNYSYTPDFDDDIDGLTISLWVRFARPGLDQFSTHDVPKLYFYKEDQGGYYTFGEDFVWHSFAFFNDYLEIFSEISVDWHWDSSYFIDALISTEAVQQGKKPEDFFLGPVNDLSRPLVWRHIAYQYHAENADWKVFLDGRKMGDTDIGTRAQKFVDEGFWDPWTMDELWSNLQLRLRSGTQGMGGKFAQMRIYPSLLTPEQILNIAQNSKWPSGEAMRQCKDEILDEDFQDESARDDLGNTCQWYAEIRKTIPLICNTNFARANCPVTCESQRLCHDGSILPTWKRSNPKAKYQIWDRIQYFVPRYDSMICPRKSVVMDDILESCRGYEAQTDFYDSGLGNYSAFYTVSDLQVHKRGDLRKCEDLAARLDPEQCAWDDSWLPQYLQEVKESRQWSLKFWVKAKPNSVGMPDNFWPSFYFYKHLSPPRVLAEVTQVDPRISWQWTANFGSESVTHSPEFQWEFIDAGSVDFTASWTMIVIEGRELPQGYPSAQVCVGINALPPECRTLWESDVVDSVQSFLEGIEITSEVLMSPVEVTTEFYNAAQIQTMYRDQANDMANRQGPVQNENSRLEKIKNKESQNISVSFDQPLFLVAPPLLFQSRAKIGRCSSPVTTPVLDAQRLLMRDAHCTDTVCGDLFEMGKLVSCEGEEQPETYYGISVSKLNGQEGFADFLGTMADNPVVVREGQVLPTREFIDIQTSMVKMIAVFHAPADGMSTLLEIQAELTGGTMKVDNGFKHLSYLPQDRRGAIVAIYAFMFLFIFLWFAFNLGLMISYFLETKRYGTTMLSKRVAEAVFDILQATACAVNGILSFQQIWDSEEVAKDILNKVATVPFSDPGLVMQEKVAEFFTALDELTGKLSDITILSDFVFVVMVLMLVRITATTAAHPRIGVLTGTLAHGANDLWHFTLLFMILFFFFGLTASYMFGAERPDFAGMNNAMQTQFDMLLGNIPPGYNDDNKLVIYVVLTNLTFFFLMLNFMLAIIVEGYMKVRTDIEENEAENEFLTDICLTCYSWIKSAVERWPDRRHVAQLLRSRIGSRKINRDHLLLQGLDRTSTIKLFRYYAKMDNLKTDPPTWMTSPNKYEIGYQQSFKVKQTTMKARQASFKLKKSE